MTELVPLQAVVTLSDPSGVAEARQQAGRLAARLGFDDTTAGQLALAATEAAGNMVKHGGGEVAVAPVAEGLRRGLRLVFRDRGPGIADIALAMKDGYTTGGGLGLGLSGARRLCSEFSIESKPGEGTRVAITRWR